MTRSKLLVPSILASLLAVVVVGCSVEPHDAAEDGEKAAPLPESLEELEVLADQGIITRNTPETIEIANRAHAERVSAAELRIRTVAAASSPEVGARLLATIAPAPGVERTKDGNYRVKVADAQVGEREIITMGVDATKLDLASALDGLDSTENQLAAYRALHDGIVPAARERLGAVSPESLAAQRPAVIRAAIARLADHPDLLGSLVTPSPVDEQAIETVDNTDNTCLPNAATGVFANFAFPLKSKLTPIKNQGTRGACVAFGVTSAVETARAVGGGGLQNFSEQDFYYRAKAEWFGLTNYGDGLNTGDTISMAANKNYRFANETSWPYNPAPNRLDVAGMLYLNSCQGYLFSFGGVISNYCSDTAHEGGQLCVGGTCFYSSPVGTGTGSRISSTFDILVNIVQLKAFLSLNKAVVMSFNVPKSFKTPAVGGYVDALAIEPTIGAHALHVVGTIDNAQLAVTRPGAPPGAGGGYVILKNSWGTCFGDGGFVYMSYSTLNAFAYGLRVVDVAN